MAVPARKLHKQIVRMLTIDQQGAAIGSFTGRQQQRIALRAHQRFRAEHGR